MLARRLISYLLELLIGQNDLRLRVARPYVIDETENVVRLSENNMKLLGVEESDEIEICILKNSYIAKVFKIDDYDKLLKENRIKKENETDYIICLPTFIRKELGLNYINETVHVRRNLKFLLLKNMNSQVFSIIGLIVSLQFINNINNITIRILSIFLLFIFFVFLSFSNYRAKICKKNKR